MAIGIHILGELYGVDQRTLSYVEHLEPLLLKILRDHDFKILTSAFHQFHPFGVTGFVLLSESHVSVHTWPEESYIALDIFSCSSEEQALRAFEAICKELAPAEVDRKIIDRGVSWKSLGVFSSPSYETVREACGTS
jgi:S-adenosylmethionine decarboxylase